jgi:hypothetical protein
MTGSEEEIFSLEDTKEEKDEDVSNEQGAGLLVVVCPLLMVALQVLLGMVKVSKIIILNLFVCLFILLSFPL